MRRMPEPISVRMSFIRAFFAYSQKKYPEGPRQTAGRFLGLKKFPGRRALRNHPIATLEAALSRRRCADKLIRSC